VRVPWELREDAAPPPVGCRRWAAAFLAAHTCSASSVGELREGAAPPPGRLSPLGGGLPGCAALELGGRRACHASAPVLRCVGLVGGEGSPAKSRGLLQPSRRVIRSHLSEQGCLPTAGAVGLGGRPGH